MVRRWIILGVLGLCSMLGAGGVLAFPLTPSLPQVYWGRPLNQGLTDWWLVLPTWNVGLASLRNIANPARNGTLTNMATTGSTTSGAQKQTTRPGGNGHLAFDGTNDSVVLSAQPTQNLSVWSFSLWYRTTSATGPTWIITKGNASQYSWQLQLASADVTQLNLITYDCAGSTLRFNSSTPSIGANDGNWHHVVIVYQDGVRGEFFFDGRSVRSSTTFVAATQCATSTANVTLGARGDAAVNFLNGSMDDVRIWNRALNASEARAIYDDSRTDYRATLIGFQGGAVAGGPTRKRLWVY